VTIHVADIAKWQGALTLADLRAAGFTGINVKVSHGVGLQSVHPNVSTYVRDAPAAGMTTGTFHWLTGTASGAAQATYAFQRMQELPGGITELAHTVDVEETMLPHPTEKQYLEYCEAMAQLLGREIATYSGDWWWNSRARTWQPSPCSPWLWSSPRAGYLGSYPGDVSAHWAGYGPWPELAVMQYAVKPVAGIRVSMSAVRDHGLWDLMRGAGVAINSVPASTSLRDEVNWLAPGRDTASDGTIGDPAHAGSTSDHNPDETGNTGGSEDADSINEVHARDIDSSGPWPADWSMERIVQLILSRCRSGAEDRLKYIIYNRRIWSRSSNWKESRYAGPNPHDKHGHFSFRYGSGTSGNPEQDTSGWGIRAAREAELRELEDIDVTPDDIEKIAEAAARATHGKLIGRRDVSLAVELDRTYQTVTFGTGSGAILASRLDAIEARQIALQSAVADVLKALKDDEPVPPEALDAALGNIAFPRSFARDMDLGYDFAQEHQYPDAEMDGTHSDS
jgi:hypothetical protein